MARRGYNHPVLRWLARILSLASLGMLLLFVLGEGSWPLRLTPSEFVQFVFFPIGVAIGMVLGWRRELLGGVVAVFSLAMFYLSHFGVTGKIPSGPWFLIFTLPGILFFALGLWKQARTA
ncbi:MAG: DUF7670 domain-containing protein [Chloroflexota bacterium]|jgi:hypothetical protein